MDSISETGTIEVCWRKRRLEVTEPRGKDLDLMLIGRLSRQFADYLRRIQELIEGPDATDEDTPIKIDRLETLAHNTVRHVVMRMQAYLNKHVIGIDGRRCSADEVEKIVGAKPEEGELELEDWLGISNQIVHQLGEKARLGKSRALSV